MTKNESGKWHSKINISFVVLLVFIAMMVTSISACGFLGFGRTKNWKEEVQLSDGRIIIVERTTIREGGGGEIVSNPSGTKPKEYRIRFAHPDGSGKMIEWCSTKTSPGTYPEIPLNLDTESGQIIIFTAVSISIACEVYNKYVYKNGIWIEEALPDKFEKRATNLFIKLGVNMPKFVNLETKRKGNAEIGYRQSFRQVGPNRKVCG